MIVAQSKLFSDIETVRDELIRTTKELVSIPTVNPPGENFDEISSLLAKRFEGLSMKVESISVPKSELDSLAPLGKGLPRTHVLGTWESNENGPTVILNGHYDVVPPSGNWTTDPFKPVVKDGRIYGRGTIDMKSGIATFLVALRMIKRAGIEIKGKIVASAVPDEETGADSGVKYLLRKGLLKGDYAIVTEPSGPDVVMNAVRGALWLEISTIGKLAHGGMPNLGINAFEKLVKVASGLMNMKSEFQKTKSAHLTEPPEGTHPTMTMGGVVQGGVKVNVVPDRCSMTVDRRLIPEETLEGAMNQIRNAVEQLKNEDKDLKAEIKVINEVHPGVTPLDNRVCKTMAEACKEVLGMEPRFRMNPGYSDMAHMIHYGGIPSVHYGPSPIEMCHQRDEYVQIDSMVDVAKVIASTLVKLCAKT